MSEGPFSAPGGPHGALVVHQGVDRLPGIGSDIAAPGAAEQAYEAAGLVPLKS